MQSFTASRKVSGTEAISTDRPVVRRVPAYWSTEAADCGSELAEGDGLLHDARNLLGAMRLYCDLLNQGGTLPVRQRGYAEELRRLCDKTHGLMERWVDSARGRELGGAVGTQAAGPEVEEAASLVMQEAGGPAVPLGELVRRCAGLLEQIAGERVVWSVGPGACAAVRLSEETVERVLVNLVRNAVNAVERKGEGTVRICVGRVENGPGRYVELAVEDDGCGMGESELAALDGAAGKGRGMGLRIVRGMAEHAGGWMTIASREGEGTRVSTCWPVAGRRGSDAPEAGHKQARGRAGRGSPPVAKRTGSAATALRRCAW